MRRKDREIRNLEDIFLVVEKCRVVHVAMIDEGKPYVVALNFGFDRRKDGLVLYLHSACEGRKITILKENPNVYFQMDCDSGLVRGTPENPCSYSWNFASVMGSGQVEFIEGGQEKKYALNRILQHIGETEESFDFPPQVLSRTCVCRIDVRDVSGKRHG
ncbi:pyridoxamine 5'-phosphate oxidase family protein [Lachnospiraceae bacterium]|nr:pyridoxamine 5'-phosphate oxidase family protein [Lachnospiraceae bacterium]